MIVFGLRRIPITNKRASGPAEKPSTTVPLGKRKNGQRGQREREEGEEAKEEERESEERGGVIYSGKYRG